MAAFPIVVKHGENDGIAADSEQANETQHALFVQAHARTGSDVVASCDVTDVHLNRTREHVVLYYQLIFKKNKIIQALTNIN